MQRTGNREQRTGNRGKILVRKCFLSAVAVLSFPLFTAMEWPSQEASMVRNFGFNDRGRPVLGGVFEGEGQVLASNDGELIFSRTSWGDTASRLPSPLGAWSAVDHGDGMVSVYSRYIDEERNVRLRRVIQGTPVALAGVSGWSKRDGFYFSLYDRRERRWVNPSMVIAPFPGERLPQISGVQLRNTQGRLAEGNQIRNVSQGGYTVAVNAVDGSPDAGQYSPYRIVCSINGIEVGTLLLDTISARDGILTVNRDGFVPVSKVYAPYPAFEVGEIYLNRGQAILEIVVQDITGDSRSMSTRIVVE
jgi:hypothetical protein